MNGVFEFSRDYPYKSFNFSSLDELRDRLKCSVFFKSYNLKKHERHDALVCGRGSDGALVFIGSIVT